MFPPDITADVSGPAGTYLAKAWALIPAPDQTGCHRHGSKFLINDLHIFNALKYNKIEHCYVSNLNTLKINI